MDETREWVTSEPERFCWDISGEMVVAIVWRVQHPCDDRRKQSVENVNLSTA